jgi:hypothetical protein
MLLGHLTRSQFGSDLVGSVGSLSQQPHGLTQARSIFFGRHVLTTTHPNGNEVDQPQTCSYDKQQGSARKGSLHVLKGKSYPQEARGYRNIGVFTGAEDEEECASEPSPAQGYRLLRAGPAPSQIEPTLPSEPRPQ